MWTKEKSGGALAARLSQPAKLLFADSGVQLSVEFELSGGDLVDFASAKLGDSLPPEGDGAGSNTESLSSYGGSGIDRVEMCQNVFLEHEPDYSMLIADCNHAIETPVYSAPMQTMGDRIRLLREAKGWSQAHLADLVGVTAGAISQWETGLTKNVKLETFLTLCSELGTNPHYLIFGPSTPGHPTKRRSSG